MVGDNVALLTLVRGLRIRNTQFKNKQLIDVGRARTVEYNIKTDVFGGRIIQEISCVDNNKTTRLSRWIVDTRDKDVHQALLKLGWKPPIQEVTTEAKCSLVCVAPSEDCCDFLKPGICQWPR